MITIQGLSKTYGGLHACDNISLSVEPGSTTAIVGPNGAGKSTLVQLLSGVTRADAGSIRFGDIDVTRLSPAHRFSLGMVRSFQTARVFPGLNVLDSVRVGAYYGLFYASHPFSLGSTVRDATASLLQLPSWHVRYREAERHALEIIDLFGERLSPRLDHYTFTLSYANRRRVEIARALASRPKLLMLDEPTAGMNPTETEELARLLRDIKAARPELTLVFIEHKMNVVRQMSQRVIVMDAGRVIADDTPDAALNDPKVIEAYLGGGHRAAQA
ncbi:ABC transporter ATP-binding protein [Castellaniella sp.]|uniref:ABC transporter ATP-binding protein n=1 Tax=Castellaniella sp. TaxID=1955812 RepID=UPI00356248CC